MKKHYILIFIIIGLLIGVLFLLFGGDKKIVEYPELEDLDEFARSIFHDGQAIISSDFDESIIKSALIVKAKLIDYEITEESYVIYHFMIQDHIKNDFGDMDVYVYEPKLSSGNLLYEKEGSYVLILSRTIDLYYLDPVCHNFNSARIHLDDNDEVIVAEANAGELDLSAEKDINNYQDLKDYFSQVRAGNTEIKEATYAFEGRHILSTDYSDIIEGSTYIQLITMTEILYENRLLRECMFEVEKSYKGQVEDFIIVSIPAYLDIEVGGTYLAGLYKDGNYNISGANSFISTNYEDVIEAYEALLDVYEEEEEEEEEAVIIPEDRQWLINPDYLSYYKINEDVVGWFKIADTVIDYPVLQGADNEYYLYHDLYCDESSEASIIMDYRMNIQSMQNQTLVYGHNMKRGTMFHEITYYKDKTYFDAHPYIEFNTLYDDMLWEVFSVHVIDSNYTYILEYPLADETEYQAYLDDVIERSMFITDIEVTTDDQILTLVTCSYEFDGARTILHAKLVEKSSVE